MFSGIYLYKVVLLDKYIIVVLNSLIPRTQPSDQTQASIVWTQEVYCQTY